MRYTCHTCNEIAPQQQKEPLILTPLPQYPFQQIFTDYFEITAHHYLSVVDRFSGWLNIYHYPPHKAIADTPINTCQTIFISYGIPEEMSTEGIVYSYLKTLMVFIADTGAKVSVCSLEQAKKRKLIDKMFSTYIKLKPFNSDPIKVERQAICAVTFGSNSVPVKWQITAAECEPILAGNSAMALGIIEFNRK